ncbi:MAG: hypothetical protein EOO04_04620 [Chitinophagaceae bacterium]|nr:MAG: hypothetical protein EOO04_04620 [Chitinophagaceae bacterium]
MNKKACAAILLLITVLNACTSLKPISDAAAKSQKSLAVFEELPTTYTGFCEERCQFTLVRKSEIKRDSTRGCDCKLFTAADRATVKVYNAINAYFKSLGALSKGDLTTYDTKALSEALTEGQFASLTIDKKTVTAYSSLGRLLLQVFTDSYRKKKLSTVIETGNEPLQTLLSVFGTSIGNLVSELEFQKERNYALYAELILSEGSAYEKLTLSNNYYNEITRLKQKQEQLRTFAKSLVAIGKGHQNLYENRNKLTSKEIRELMADYSASLQDLIVDFNKL